jgi:type VI secretion system secreted protein VgrG
MDTNTISNTCLAAGGLGSWRDDFGSFGFAGDPGTGVPEPGTVATMGAGLLALAGWKYRRRRVA